MDRWSLLPKRLGLILKPLLHRANSSVLFGKYFYRLPSSLKNLKNMDSSSSSSEITESTDLWHDLPKDLLQLILERLSVNDNFAFGYVCTTWFSAMIDRPPQCSKQPPWLLTGFNYKERVTCFTFFNSSKRFLEEYCIRLVMDSRGWRCLGSSFGWLIFSSGNNKNLYLVNPLSCRVIVMPSSRWNIKFSKAVLSSSVNSNCCYLAAISFDGTRGAARIVGDTEWTMTNTLTSATRDLVFHKEKLYILGGRGEVVVYSCDSLPTCITTIQTVPAPTKLNINRTYLVNSDNDMLLVKVPVYKYGVFKLVKNLTRWVRIRSLGNQTLFLGSRGSESVSAEELKGTVFASNYVYYKSEAELFGIPMDKVSTCFVLSLPRQTMSLWYMPGL